MNLREYYRNCSMKKVFRPGVFDTFHIGHLNCINHAATLGDHLIVGVQDDREVKKQKGRLPIYNLQARMQILGAIKGIDEVISYRSADLRKLLKYLEISVLAVGTDYGQLPEHKATLDYCLANGIEVDFSNRTAGVSTTQIMDKIHRQIFWEERAQNRQPTTLSSFGGDTKAIKDETSKEVDIISKYLTGKEILLDLGCGDGRLAIPLATKCRHIDAVDFAKNSINQINSLGIANISAKIGTVYDFDKQYDVVLMSGIFPCLDDQQVRAFFKNVDYAIKSGGYILVRSSVAIEHRIDIIRQFSEDLDSLYSAYYRTAQEIIDLFEDFDLVENHFLYANHEDTEVRFMAFRRR